jgi:predicted ribosome quality control (RQC) complex YloA/Tae2 family protein
VKKKKKADDRRMSAENNGASRLIIKARGDRPLPTTLAEQSQ